MNGRPMSIDTSSGVNGPSPPRVRLPPADLRQQPVPAAEQVPDGRGNLSSDHPAAIISWSTRTYPDARSSSRKSQAISQWRHSGSGPAYIRALAVEQPRVLGLEHREDELLLAAEVVVDLAERHARFLGDGPRRQVGVALREEARPGGGEDRGTGLGGRLSRRSARVTGRRSLVHGPPRIRRLVTR